MFRTDTSVGMLKAIAMIASLAVLLWSLGLPSLRFADAANLTTVSDTISDSLPSAESTHEITFTSPTGIANGTTITIDFSSFSLNSVDYTDIDVDTGSDLTVGGDCTSTQIGATWSSNTLVLEFCASGGQSVAPNGTTTIEIGTNATFGVAGDTNLINPASEGSVQIPITAGASDTGTAMVVILANVLVSAAVDTIFNFTVEGTSAGTLVNSQASTVDSSSTTIPFGTLKAGIATTTAHLLKVGTNAKNGYIVTVQSDGPLQSSTGADIDYFTEGSDTDTPTTWGSGPTGTIGSENTYGHWGVTSDDTDIASRTGNQFGDNLFVSVSPTAHTVMAHDGPVNEAGQGQGTTTVGYRAEITALQEAGDDYTATLTYIATPTF